MRKLFLLIPALILSMMMSAKVIEISSETSNIIHYTIAASTTSDGDVIVLTSEGDQPYFSTAGADDYTGLVKDLTIKAADGVHPVVKFEVPFRSAGGKTVKFIGITFDGTSLTGYDYYFRFNDANENNLEFENCEFKNISKYVFDVYSGKKANSLKFTNCKLHDITSRGIINRGTLTSLEINGGQIYNFTGDPVLDNYTGAMLGKVKINGTEFYGNTRDIINGTATSHVDSCIINNCYFHNNTKSLVYFRSSTVSGVETCDGVIVKNSTFANNDLSTDSRSVIDVFNNGETEAANIEVTVDHCTFYNNTTKNFDYSCIRSRKSTKVNITNSIFAYPSAIDFYATNCYGGTISNTLVYNLSRGHRTSSSKPVVTNTITADPLFTDAANGDFSLAGDWETPSISPARGAATDGSDLGDPRWYSAEVLPSADFASPYVLDGLHAKLHGNIALDGDNFLKQNNNSDPTQHGTATWKIHATKSCYVSVTPDIKGGSGHHYQIAIYDEDNNLICDPLAENDSWASDITPNFGTILIPAAGDYKVVLSNLMNNSGATLRKITLAYVGGDVQAMPGTTDIDDAWFSSNGTRAGGAINYTSVSSGCWAKWNISVTNPAWYDVTANIKGEFGHDITVEFFEDGNNTPVATAAENGTVYENDETLYPAALGLVYLPAGNYEMKFSNSVGDAALISIALVYAGGNVIDIASDVNTTLNVADAWFTSSCVREDGKIEYHEDNANAWIKWNIAATATAFYDITVNIQAPNGHELAVKIYEDENEEPIASIKESFSEEQGDLALELGRVNLIAGKNYVVKVTNTPSGSKAKVLNVVFAPVTSTTTTLPGTFNFNDAVLSEKAFVQDGMLYFNQIGDYTPVGQYAQWEVTTDHNGKFLFELNATSTNGQRYKITIFDNLNNKVDSCEENFESGDKTMKHFFVLTAGNYFVKVENTRSYSKGHLTSLVATEPEVIVLNEEATDISAIIAENYNTSAKHYQLIRTLKAGMYNTFCSPLYLSSKVCKAVFGDDVEIYTLEAAVADGAVLNVELKSSSDVWQGTPVFIKPSRDIVNPIFNDVEMKADRPASTTKTNANLVGTFVQTSLQPENNVLYLGPNNMLYYPEVETTIKGMRAWFAIHDAPTPAPMIKRMRIVENANVVTEINYVDAEGKTIKTIENGQLIIFRDGNKYNVMGVKLQ